MFKSKTLILIIPFIFACSDLYSQSLENKIQEFMKKENVPGIFVGVVKSDSVLFRKGFGFSDIENNVPVTPRTCMELGSISKIFTAETIINLSTRKLLNLNDPVTKYIKNAPSEWSSITINHLLMHASGIQNYLLDSRFNADVLFQPDSPDTLLNVFLNGVSTDRMTEMFFSLPLEFSPGETWSYSNTGYYLLGKIAESVISGNFFDYAADSIFMPMNMVNVNTGEHALKNRCLSKGYINTAEGLKRARTLPGNYAFSAGAWAVTGDDMIEFLKFLHLKKLPSDKAGYDWKTRITYKNHPFTYNGGRFFGIFHGKHIICHNGGTPGFSSSWIHVTEDTISIIILANLQDYAPVDHLAWDVLSDYVPSLRFPLQKIETNESKYWESLISDVITSLQFNKPLPSVCSKPLRIFMESENGRGLWNWYFSKGFPDSMYCTDAEINEDYNTFRFRLTAHDKAEYRLSAIISKENELIQLRWW